MKLLLVQDNLDDAEFLTRALRRQSVDGMEFVHVKCLADMAEAMTASSFDVVLLDLNLPDGAGLECVDAVKAVDDELPIIVLSEQDDESLAVDILNRGAQDYLVKWEGQGRTILRSIRHSMERKRAEMRLSYLAQYDPLTGIPNRQFFSDQLHRAIAHSVDDNRPVTLLFLDLDEFKYINDTLGHDAGDCLLKEVADRICRSVRSGDVVARLGGDEFAVLLEGLATPQQVEAVATSLLDLVSKPYDIAGRQMNVTTSIGISMFPNDHADQDMLLKNADIAMYKAKELGGNVFRFFHEQMQADLVAYHEIERDIRLAMERDEFYLDYQPKINVHTNQLQGLEALLRWNSPDRGLVGPDEFIPVAEESGRIVPLGAWVLEEVCRTLLRWRTSGLKLVPVSVNVSARQFQQPDFHKRVAEILERFDIPASLIELELTEGLVMSDVESAQRELAKFKSMGLRISIDDFGTGYSCLSYLRRFPIDVLKIDRSFVQDIGLSTDGEFIIEAIISLARSLRLETVAEGVETHEQLNYLIDNGCHVVQGFVTGRPMPGSKIEPLLAAVEQGNTDSTAVTRILTGVA